MKRKIQFSLKIFVILLISLACFSKMSIFYAVFGKSSKEQDPDRLTTLFYHLPENSVDILFLGDSHTYCTYNSQLIYDETGITSASLATSSASVISSYWQLQEALKTQNIQVVVMDSHCFEIGNSLKDDNLMLHFTSGITMLPTFSVNKIYNYIDIKKHSYGLANNVGIYDIYSFFAFKEDFDRDYKSGIKEIKDIFFNPAKLYKTFGYYPTTETKILSDINTYKNNQTYFDFSETLECEYLNKIYNLCSENSITFVLSRAIYEDENDYHGFNIQIENWAKENGVLFIDYFNLIEECDIDYSHDFKDTDHFNYYGSKKATYYFIKNIIPNLKIIINEKNDALWRKNEYSYPE